MKPLSTTRNLKANKIKKRKKMKMRNWMRKRRKKTKRKRQQWGEGRWRQLTKTTTYVIK